MMSDYYVQWLVLSLLTARLKEYTEANRHRRRKEDEVKDGDLDISNKLLAWVDSDRRTAKRQELKV